MSMQSKLASVAVPALALALLGTMPAAEAEKARIQSTKPSVETSATAKKNRTTFKRVQRGPSKPVAPVAGQKFTSNGRGGVADLYCKNNSSKYQPCDWLFWDYCKLIGGTPSGRQPWGGQTCYHPTEW